MTRRLDAGRAKVLWALYLPDAIDLHLSCGHVARMTRAWLERRGERLGRGSRVQGKWGRCRQCAAGQPIGGNGTAVEHGTDERVVEEIRTAYRAGGITQKALGTRYGLSQSAVSKILSGQRRTDVTGAR